MLSRLSNRSCRCLKTVVVMLTLALVLSTGGMSLAQSGDGLEGELTFYWYEDRFADTMESYIDQFEAMYPEATINLEILPFGTYFEKLPVQIASGTAPDVFFLVSGQVQNYARMDTLLDLGSCVTPEELEPFRSAQIDFSTYNDKLIALPFTTTVLTLLVNEDLFNEAGIEIPRTFEDAWTWEEFADVLRTLKETGNLVNVMHNGGRDFWWLPWFYGNGASLFNETMDAPAFSSPEALETFEYLRGLTEEGLIDVPPTGGASAQEVQQLFVQGRQAIFSAGHWDLTGLVEALGDSFKLNAAMFPVSSSNSLALGGDYLVISKDTDNPELACEFIKFLTSAEITEDYSERYYYLAPRVDVAPEYTEHAEIMELVASQADAQASSELTLHRGLPFYADINSVFSAEYQLVMLGERSPEDALAAIDEATAQALASAE